MQPKAKRLYLPKVKIVSFIVLSVLVLLVLVKGVLWSQKVMRQTGLTPKTILGLVFDTGAPLASFGERTNILILGIGGGSHAGPDLTDTMMVISLNAKKSSMALISIPRDVWSDTLKDKVNSAYHYGEAKQKGGGLTLAKAISEDVLGIPIQYSAVIDFSGFKKIIDLVGGITVNVPEGFIDSEFPIEGKENDLCGGDPLFRCRYETVRFDAGIQQMDGARALTYVRSRRAEGTEGSDFARARRQQIVLVALKEKLMKVSTWFPPKRSIALMSAIDEATDTDMNIATWLTVGREIATTKEASIQRVTIDDLLTSPPVSLYGRYVLVPKDSFDAIYEYIKKQLE